MIYECLCVNPQAILCKPSAFKQPSLLYLKLTVSTQYHVKENRTHSRQTTFNSGPDFDYFYVPQMSSFSISFGLQNKKNHSPHFKYCEDTVRETHHLEPIHWLWRVIFQHLIKFSDCQLYELAPSRVTSTRMPSGTVCHRDKVKVTPCILCSRTALSV